MKKRRDFYELFFPALKKRHFDIKPSTSADYIADIYHKGRLIAFYTRADAIAQNPFLDVKDTLIDTLNETARSCALRAGVCVDKPYDEEKSEKMPDGSRKMAEYNDTVLTCKHHHLFGYIFATYRLSPDDSQIMQRERFYNKAEALQSFATRSGLVDERLMFSETELKIIRSNLIKMAVNFDGELSKDSIKAMKTLVERIEEVRPELSDRENEFDFSQEFQTEEEYEIGD